MRNAASRFKKLLLKEHFYGAMKEMIAESKLLGQGLCSPFLHKRKQIFPFKKRRGGRGGEEDEGIKKEKETATWLLVK